jgi:hypothetical protein
MYPQKIKIYTDRAPITTWVHASILGPQKEWMISSLEIIAALYNPSYEGEYYFTPSSILDQQHVHTRIAYYLFTLETSGDSLKHAIQTRKKYLQTLVENPKLDHLNLDIHQLLSLSQKITQASYSHPLKITLILDIYYQAYLCIKDTMLPEHIENTLFNIEMGLNVLNDTHQPNSKHYAIINLLLSALYYHCAVAFQNDIQEVTFQIKANYYFEKAIQHDVQSPHLLHHDWIKDLKNTVFECHSNHMPSQKDKLLHLNLLETPSLKNNNTVFAHIKGISTTDCLEAIKIAYQEISSRILTPSLRAKQLLTLCETAQKSCMNTETLITFLLDIYYEIYIIFKETKKVLSDDHEIMFEFFVCLKKLIILENVNSKYHEIINILLCTPFECGMKLQETFNNVLKCEHSDKYFNNALLCHLNNDEPINLYWANPLRFSMLQSITLRGKHNHSMPEKIVLALIQMGNEKATHWLTPSTNIPLQEECQNITVAIEYYSTVIWLKNVGLYNDTMMKCHAITKTKINILRAHLERSLTEKQLLLAKPIATYLKAGNHLFPNLNTLMKNVAFQDQLFLLSLREGAEQKLTQERFMFLVETCNAISLPYASDINIIIGLDLYHQVYRFIKKNKAFRSHDLLLNLKKRILLLQQCTDENHMLHEAYFIFLFQICHLFNETTQNLPETKENIRSFFINAIQFKTTRFLKAAWITLLRKEALLNYAKHFCTIPGVNLHITLEQIFLHFNVISKTKPTSKADKRYMLEANHILSWATGVQLLTEPLAAVLAETLQNKHIKPITDSKKSKPKQAALKVQTHAEKEAQLQIEKQKIAEQHRKTVEMKDAIEKSEKERELKQKQSLLAKEREQREFKKAQEEAKRKQELVHRAKPKVSKKDMRKVERTLRETAVKLETLAQQELKQKQEQKAFETEASELQRRAFTEQNSIAKQARKISILERPLRSLRNFSLDEFSPTELSLDNQQSLNDLVTTLGNFGTLEIYGSYVVFLASLRLDIPSEKIRNPGDIDMRIKLNYSSFEDYTRFIQTVFTLGFSCQEFNINANTEELQKYIKTKQQKGGHLNVTKAPMSNVQGSYEIELAILFPNYRPNTNPFSLLKHYISIYGNTASFNNGHKESTKQLATHVLKSNFDCNLHEVMTLEYNVFNFFPRAIKNKLAWSLYFNMQKGNMAQIFSNPKLVQDFFSIRFYAHRYKDCYLEIAGLITQQYFLTAEATFILQGFLNSFLSMINVESNDRLKQNFIHPKWICHYAKKITKELQLQFARDPMLFGESKEKNEICQAFYKQFVHCLDKFCINADKNIASFLENSRVIPTSILFDLFKALQKPEPVSELESEDYASPCPTPHSMPYVPVPYDAPCMMMSYPVFYPYDPYLIPPPLVYCFQHQINTGLEFPPPYPEDECPHSPTPEH